MRPVTLTMSAFGAYAGLVTLPMERLGKKGLYLVTGDTGAGKTTIFDAICYALFGEMSGSDRESQMMRSKYASDHEKTFVELAFDYHDKRYTVRRNPKYMRTKSRGEGMTQEEPSAALTMPDGNLVTGIKEVTAKIKDLLGMDKEQFCKISMIAQGEFRKLLLASTEERVTIFRHIFGTRRYEILQNQLKSEAISLGSECKLLGEALGQYMDGIVCREQHPYYEEVLGMKESGWKPEEVLELLERLIAHDQESYEQVQADMQLAVKELEDINAQLGTIQVQKEISSSLEEKCKRLHELEPQLEEAEKALLREEARADKREELQKEIALQEGMLSEYDKAECLKADIVMREGKIQLERDKIKRYKEQQEQIQRRLEEDKEKRRQLEGCDANYVSMKRECEQLENGSQRLKRLWQQRETCALAEKMLLKHQERYQSLLKEAGRQQEIYAMHMQLFMDEQAGIMAEHLVRQEQELKRELPCPVCGSFNHPKLAVLSKAVMTQEELEKEKSRSEQAHKEVALASREAGKYKQMFEDEMEHLIEAWMELLGEETDAQNYMCEEKTRHLTDEEERMKLQQEQAEVRMQTIQHNMQLKEQLDRNIPTLEEQLTDLAIRLKEAEVMCGQLAEGIRRDTQTLEESRRILLYEDKKKAQTALQNKKKQWKQMELEWRQADEKQKRLKSEEAALQGSVESLKDQLQGNIKAGLEREEELLLLKKQVEDRRKQLQVCSEEWNAIIRTNCTNCVNISKKSEQYIAMQEKWQMVQALHLTANGGGGDHKDKIKLETYVQMAYFDRILAKANVRFMVMSAGQYEMQRCREAQNRRSQMGLEIEVLDHYNGTCRSVKTLSGGESFLASLALALGMSDEISEAAGGIALDTMFIDEGFGTLDEEALEQAIRALQELSKGERLVGIISHVDALKERIDRQIVVRKNKAQGSLAEIV